MRNGKEHRAAKKRCLTCKVRVKIQPGNLISGCVNNTWENNNMARMILKGKIPSLGTWEMDIEGAGMIEGVFDMRFPAFQTPQYSKFPGRLRFVESFRRSVTQTLHRGVFQTFKRIRV